jgi:putative hydrolase of HD superfamily
MKKEINGIIELLKKFEKLKNVKRHSKTSGGRRESAAEHSWRMALMAIMFSGYFTDIDLLKVIKMCLYHDLSEIAEGDIPAFYKTMNDEEREFNNLKKMLEDADSELSELTEDILGTVNEFNLQRTEEAKLAAAIDKLEGIIQHNEADIKTWIKREYKFNLEYGYEETAYNSFLREFREAVRKISIDKIKNKS